MKRYPKSREDQLAYRIASAQIEAESSITKAGSTPADLESVFAHYPYFAWSHIYGFEHDEVGTDDSDGYVLTKAAEKRVQRMALNIYFSKKRHGGVLA